MKKLVFLCIFIFININFAEAQEWQSVRGIKDTDLKAIAVDQKNPDIIYVGSKFIYKTEDGGKSWQEVWTVPAMASVNFLLTDGNSVYAATENGLFKSNDGGKNWQRIFKGRDEENNVFCLDLDKQNNLIYIGTQKGLFRTKDGKSWQRSRGKLDDAEIYRVKVDSGDANLIYAVTDEGFFKTNNQGNSWRKTFVISKIAEGEEAEEEEELTDKLNDLAIGRDAIYLVGKDTLLKSKDKGETYQEMDKGILRGADIRSIILSDNKIYPVKSAKGGIRRGELFNKVYLGTDRGVFRMHATRSTPHAPGLKSIEREGKGEIEESWEEIYAGLPSLDVRKIALAGDNLWAITGKGIFTLHATRYTLQAKNKENKEKLEKNKEVSIEQEIFKLFVHEPSIREVQEKAIEYAEVHPDKIKNWRRLSAKRAILPKFTAGANRNVSDLYHWEGGSTKTVDDDFLRKGKEAIEWDVSLTWELGDLIWNDDQTSIDARSRLMVQLREDILDEVTRTYFERKRLKIELFLSPPKDDQKKLEKELRLEELTANLDALTGGWFSENITDGTDI